MFLNLHLFHEEKVARPSRSRVQPHQTGEGPSIGPVSLPEHEDTPFVLILEAEALVGAFEDD